MMASRRSAARSARLDGGLNDEAFGLAVSTVAAFSPRRPVAAFPPRRPLADFDGAAPEGPVPVRELGMTKI